MLFDKIINTAFSVGAAIVIFGAWSKIEHKEFGDTALTAGLLTETAIFFIYGMLEWRKQPAASVQEDTAGRTAGNSTPAPPIASPVQKENVEELTDSIRQTAHILSKIFRV